MQFGVTELVPQSSGSHDIGEHEGAKCSVLLTGRAEGGAELVLAAPAQERCDQIALDADDLVRYQAVGFAIDGIAGFLIGGLHQAADRAPCFIEPILEVLHAVGFLGLEVGDVPFADAGRCGIGQVR